MKLEVNFCKILHRNIKKNECECEANKRRRALADQLEQLFKGIEKLTAYENICYTCFLQKRIVVKEKGCGLGRINKSVDWKDGIYKLFYISSIHKKLRDGAERQAGVEQAMDYQN